MLLILIFVVILFFVGHNEHIRYKHAYTDCATQRDADRELLIRDVCFNPDDRLFFRESVDCEGAERRLRLSVVACAIFKWGATSGVADLYKTLTGSYLALFGTIMTPLLFSMWLWKSHKTELAFADRMERIMGTVKKIKKKEMGTAVCYR